MTDREKILLSISKCEDPKLLRNWIENAANDAEIYNAAFRRLISLVPSEKAGTLEHDFWQTINAFELILSQERGRTTRLSRTRQKVARVGVKKTLEDWATSEKKTDGFKMLLERDMPEFTGEAIVLRHSKEFEEAAVIAAQRRLAAEGVDTLKVSLSPI